MTASIDPHALLVAVVGDIFRAGLDGARVRLGPKAEREVIAGAVEALELTGYRLVRDNVDVIDRLTATYEQACAELDAHDTTDRATRIAVAALVLQRLLDPPRNPLGDSANDDE